MLIMQYSFKKCSSCSGKCIGSSRHRQPLLQLPVKRVRTRRKQSRNQRVSRAFNVNKKHRSPFIHEAPGLHSSCRMSILMLFRTNASLRTGEHLPATAPQWPSGSGHPGPPMSGVARLTANADGSQKLELQASPNNTHTTHNGSRRRLLAAGNA